MSTDMSEKQEVLDKTRPRSSKPMISESVKTRPSPTGDQDTKRRPKLRSKAEVDGDRGLLDGLPIQHVTKEEWEQMGMSISPRLPSASAPLFPPNPPVTYVDQGGKYKEVGPISSTPSGVRKKLDVIMKTPIELAIIVQKLFIALYMICQGFLGGLALAHLILAFSAGLSTDFVNVYSSFARPYQALFYILTLLCMLSALDRCDLCHSHYFYDLLRSQPLVLITLVVYSVTLVITCHTSFWDHRLSTGIHNVTLWEAGLAATPNQLVVWKRLSIVRCVGGILGWLLVSLFPNRDGVSFRLVSIQELQNQ